MSKFTLLFFLQSYSGVLQVDFNVKNRIDAEMDDFFHDADLQVSPQLLHDINQKASTAVSRAKK
jgi:hypothetical protein